MFSQITLFRLFLIIVCKQFHIIILCEHSVSDVNEKLCVSVISLVFGIKADIGQPLVQATYDN